MSAEPKRKWEITASDRRFLRALRLTEGNTVKGTRLADGTRKSMPAGSYGRNAAGIWEACSPNGRRGTLEDHKVTEHEDGTITVEPSILIDPILGGDGADAKPFRRGWHGFLERGIWREC